MGKDRVAGPAVAAAFAVLFLGLGSYLGARPSVDPQHELAALRADIDLLRKQQELAPTRAAGISPPPPVVDAPVFDHEKRAAIVADVKRQLQTEMGLLPLTLIRDRRHSFVELYSYDDRGASSYGTAGYLGNGYFITVKHGVVALGQEGASDPRVINSIKLMIDGRPISARVVDAGDARVEVDPGDWAILKVNENIDLPALHVGLNYQFEFADPIFRLGNDYSKGIVVSTGYVGQRTPEKLVTCLTDGHPGVSGGGVLNLEGRLVGIPIGRMQGDFRFSFILPLRDEMFQKVKFAPVTHVSVPYDRLEAMVRSSRASVHSRRRDPCQSSTSSGANAQVSRHRFAVSGEVICCAAASARVGAAELRAHCVVSDARRPAATRNSAHLRPFSARRTAACPLPFQRPCDAASSQRTGGLK